MDIDQIRDDTPACQNIIHFNNAGAALMPRQVANAIRDYIWEEENGGGYETAEKRWIELNMFYDAASQLLHCKSSNLAFTTSATDSYNRALSSIAFREGDTILIS
ncbi:MAG TPA: hypothetical protein VKR32_19450, partial [Puia sp.]|nr:hypothetical protein [Puia sp.]